MKSKFILCHVVLCFLISSCRDKKNHIRGNNEVNKLIKHREKVTVESETVVYQKEEYLSEMMYINKKYPLEGENDALLNFLPKRIDSINSNGYECGSILEEKHKVLFFLDSELEISKNKYAFRRINFITSNYTLNHNTITFSKDYSLSDFKNDFPVVFARNKTIEEDKIIITVSTHELTDDSYIFTFKNYKLVELHYFFPC